LAFEGWKMTTRKPLKPITPLPLSTKVLVGGSIEGVVDEVIWRRGMEMPVYLVEWWEGGDVLSRRFLLEDIQVLDHLPGT